MNTSIAEVLGQMTEFLKSEAKTETIIGQQFQLGEFSCVPVMSVQLGFGGGGGEGKGGEKGDKEGEGTGMGGGGGLGMGPVGFLVTRNGEIQFIATHTSKGIGMVVEKLPELMEMYLKSQKKPETNGAKVLA